MYSHKAKGAGAACWPRGPACPQGVHCFSPSHTLHQAVSGLEQALSNELDKPMGVSYYFPVTYLGYLPAKLWLYICPCIYTWPPNNLGLNCAVINQPVLFQGQLRGWNLHKQGACWLKMDFRLCQGSAPGTLTLFMGKMHIIYNVAGAIFVVSRDRHLEAESIKLAPSRQLCHSCLRHVPHRSRPRTRGPTNCTYNVSRLPSRPGSSSSVESSQRRVLKDEDHAGPHHLATLQPHEPCSVTGLVSPPLPGPCPQWRRGPASQGSWKELQEERGGASALSLHLSGFAGASNLPSLSSDGVSNPHVCSAEMLEGRVATYQAPCLVPGQLLNRRQCPIVSWVQTLPPPSCQALCPSPRRQDCQALACRPSEAGGSCSRNDEDSK